MKTKKKVVILVGANGRMGKEIAKVAQAQGWGVVRLMRGVQIPSEAPQAKIIIDFSSDEGTQLALKMAKRFRIPLLSGTTGLSAKTRTQFSNVSRVCAVASVANTSPVLLRILKFLQELSVSGVLPKKSLVVETHHAHKKDKPSGTALRIKVVLKNKTKIRSIRTGNVIGEHDISLDFLNERVNIVHSAKSRKVFAEGAWTLAQSLMTKQSGLYTDLDLLV